jgi:hypothetical protein
MDEHAGFEETSRVMFLRPELVNPSVSQLLPLTSLAILDSRVSAKSAL